MNASRTSPKPNRHQPVNRVLSLIFGFLLCAPSSAYSSQIPNFNVQFNVYALGMKLGTSNHSLNCMDADCTLKAVSSPTGSYSMNGVKKPSN